MKPGARYAILSIAVVFAIVLSCTVVVLVSFSSWAARGQFGDSFGFANSLLSGAALVGVAYALHLQRSDLVTHEEALQRAAQDLERSAATQQRIAEALSAYARLSQDVARVSVTASLLEHCRREISDLKRQDPEPADPRWKYLSELKVRERQLVDSMRSHLDNQGTQPPGGASCTGT